MRKFALDVRRTVKDKIVSRSVTLTGRVSMIVNPAIQETMSQSYIRESPSVAVVEIKSPLPGCLSLGTK